ncbi:oxidoreductase [Roseobacter cerasinus]|uniref:Oxidoreductase n=1 Tax=Roseobacter cerasinus TaxID=2602289 RepID=A0A640VTM4_9RHOB|nr:NADH:flavin oxidoreductase/NADH oxidase family protein [Roseobacter cerasinus]GFE51379.1 oxidoreductase [Roseobacter cerasinus]
MTQNHTTQLTDPLTLPCGVVLKNRIAKSAMSDSLGDGTGAPTEAQITLYETWARGGLALSIIGEVQGDPMAAEKPGNLVLWQDTVGDGFRDLAAAGAARGAHLWLQLGHAGAMTHPPIGVPKGPSTLDLPGLTCEALTQAEILQLPSQFAETARLAKDLGFGGVELHAAHGFLLSQFLSPLFNTRTDNYGGSIENRMRLTLEAVKAVRDAVGPAFPVGIKLNATDQLEGGLSQEDALAVVEALDGTSIDLIDISGGTYFPGAPSASDAAGKGPYFLEFAQSARALTDRPLMLTGGFKSFDQVQDALSRGVDMIGLARALVLQPDLPKAWLSGDTAAPTFPRFANPPEGGVTAWYSMRLTELAEGRALSGPECLPDAVAAYNARDAKRAVLWNARFR